jgi:Linalool dehydratase/isomerase
MGAVDDELALLPPCARPWGPATTCRLARLLGAYLTLVAVGSALLLLARQDALQIFGLGLLMPGGGFLAHADICTSRGIGHGLAALSSLGAFAFSLLIWFGTGNMLAPPVVWLASAVWAAGMRHGAIQGGLLKAVYASMGWAAVAMALTMLAWFAFTRRQRRLDNAYLAQQRGRLEQVFTAPTPSQGELPEMSLAHLQRLRFALDRALQADDAFEGFEHRDQFQTAALRYQLNFLGYGLALTQARFTPAFVGYTREAQRKLLLKQGQHRVWSYWALENRWGNLRGDPDPVARENIMYTGFVALQMALFQASTGCTAFSKKGALRLTHPRGQTYSHDFASLTASLTQAYQPAPYYLIACEPNWVYPLCNMMGASAVLAHDAQHGLTDWRAHAAAFRHHLEAEFLDGMGRYIPCRSARTGLALPAIGGAMPLAMPCYFLNALAPDLARRQWLLLRRRLFDARGRFRHRAFWPIDTGNYGFSRASAYTATALAAVELGDESVAAHCLAALEDECPSTLKDGVIHRAKASVWAHGVELMALAGVRDGFRRLISAPLATPGGAADAGPRLEGLRYPEVLVASAHADVPTGALQAVLYGGLGDGVHSVTVSGLRAHAVYRVKGAEVKQVQADGLGSVCLAVPLLGRTCLSVTPLEVH